MIAVTVGGIALSAASISRANQVSFLTEGELEVAEVKVAIETLTAENVGLRSRLNRSEESLTGTLLSLSRAMSDSEDCRRVIGELTQRFEAIGLDGGGERGDKHQLRLLKAVNDLRVSQGEYAVMRLTLMELLDAIISTKDAASTIESGAFDVLDAAIRHANKALFPAPAGSNSRSATTNIDDGIVISVKEDLALIVTNLGTRQGVKVGMSFQVVRDDLSVGTVRMVDARDRIAGAVIQNLRSENDTVRVGDRLKLIATQE